MLTFERRLGPLFRYRKLWFPAREAICEIARSLRPKDIVRCFAASDDISGLPGIVLHRQLRTAWVNLAGGPDEILKGMKRKSCRYEIRRAEKMLDRVDVEIETARAHEHFLAVYNDFAGRKSLPRFRRSWLKEYRQRAEILVLYLRGEPLCCHLLLRDHEKSLVRLLYSGSRRLRTSEDASACGALNRYLHWLEMQRYHAQGFTTFDFGGIRGPQDPISRFKLSFGGAVVAEHYYLLSGTQWLARLGNLIYEKLLAARAPSSQGPAARSGPDSQPSTVME
jgi:hypothetical protein